MKTVNVARSRRVFALSALASSVGLYLATPLDWYVGASGALHGLLAWGAMRLPMPRGGCLVLLLGVSVAIDQGRSISWLGEPLAPQSHYWGLACGLAMAIASGWRSLAAGSPTAERISAT